MPPSNNSSSSISIIMAYLYCPLLHLSPNQQSSCHHIITLHPMPLPPLPPIESPSTREPSPPLPPILSPRAISPLLDHGG
ncbi:hypothetical protein CLOM_g16889 [Closterium sp. NIES-68]|nr:hypothetical protein CLOM_g16889 [Closterium sp. NIES-68]